MSFYVVYPEEGVTSINTLTGAITLAAGSGITLTTMGNTITIASTDAGGTVTSVGLALPSSVFTISGSPVTTTGTLTGSFAIQVANTVFAGPATGADAVPTFRALVAADIPSGPGGFANVTLSNLDTPTAINQDLLFDPANTGSIGTPAAASTAQSNDMYVRTGDVASPGSGLAGDIHLYTGIDTDSPGNNLGNVIIDATNILPGASSGGGLGNVSFPWATLFLTGVIRDGSNQRSIEVTNRQLKAAGNVVMLDWSNSTTGLSANTHFIINVVDPVNPQDAATKAYVDAAIPAAAITSLTGDVTATGPGAAAATIAVGAVTDTKGSLSNKPAVTVVSTANVALTGVQTIDGQLTVANQSIVLATAQSTGSQNGPWLVQTGAWTRPTWFPSGGTTQAVQFSTYLIRLGSTYQGSTWRQTTAAPITIDTTALAFSITPLAVNSSTTSQLFALSTKTANYTILSSDSTIIADSNGGAFNLTLPIPSTVTGKMFRVIDKAGTFGTNNVTLVRAGSEKISGLNASRPLSADWGFYTIVSDGTDWYLG